MATSTIHGRSLAANSARSALIGGIGFDRLIAALITIFISGIYLDGWAHSHGFVDNTFFTPWHAALYGGYALNALAIGGATVWNRFRAGQGWLTAAPRGYELALLGIPLFLMGGMFDLVWHTLFGFEVGIEPLLSPAHLFLASGGFLILSSPIRAAWLRVTGDDRRGWGDLLPTVVGVAVVLSLFTFFSTYAHPFTNPFLFIGTSYENANGARGAASLLLQIIVLMGVIIFAQRRWQLPVGSMTLIITLNTALVAVFQDQYHLIPALLLVGVLADILLWRAQSAPKNPTMLRVFMSVVPAAYVLMFFLAQLIYYGSISWSLNLWLGVTFVAAIIGLFLSYLVIPPALPETRKSQ